VIEQEGTHKVRVLHEVINRGGSAYKFVLDDACSRAETDGLVLTGLVDVGEGLAVAIFIGAEHFMYEMGLTTTETLEISTEDLEGGNA
jgi:hypothetical protein